MIRSACVRSYRRERLLRCGLTMTILISPGQLPPNSPAAEEGHNQWE